MVVKLQYFAGGPMLHAVAVGWLLVKPTHGSSSRLVISVLRCSVFKALDPSGDLPVYSRLALTRPHQTVYSARTEPPA